jgi:hypothetical protein
MIGQIVDIGEGIRKIGWIILGKRRNLKKTKLSTQFLTGKKPLATRIAVIASATLPNTPPELTVPKGAL